MKLEEDRSLTKIRYEKPTAVDLGPAAPVVGASCVDGEAVGETACALVGNGDAGPCALVGNSAGDVCAFTGSSATTVCATTGSSAGTECDGGSGGAP